MRGLVVALAVLGLGTAAPVAAQAGGPQGADQRAAAQDRVRARVARLLRERVGLTEDQMRRLAPVNQRFDARRQALFREERELRQALRRELSAQAADQNRVSTQIDQLFAMQRRRVDLAAEEQRELAAIMTPVQRARYLALQETVRRRADEMRRRRGGGPARGGRRGAAAGGPPF
jgi:Spy/CpxP family protein refolding chaperone